jgi:hypothetical protein
MLRALLLKLFEIFNFLLPAFRWLLNFCIFNNSNFSDHVKIKKKKLSNFFFPIILSAPAKHSKAPLSYKTSFEESNISKHNKLRIIRRRKSRSKMPMTCRFAL